ncbi:ATP-dependent helicase HepA [Roseimaritima multifibrata]|uniref:ATP-dependent helicase HepA n=1 Tax=Roseimaritima multifibrata TaxID=1930274 RepID=A0A517MAC8_9BACT|nr:DEAD/DEAH box helicase [Roseimaritima multifibrata]QDS91836.1 ATP-dependent helicase HepA [Roseimaritima multifibrata]
MDVALSSKCLPIFDRTEMRYGAVLAKDGDVEVHFIGDQGARGVVVGAGSGGDDVTVAVSFAELEEASLLGVYCECSFFRNEAGCRHLWAFLKTIESKVDLSFPLGLEFFEAELWEIEQGKPFSQSKNRNSNPTKMAPWRQQLLSISHSLARSHDHEQVDRCAEIFAQSQTWFVINLAKQVDSPTLRLRVFRSTRKKNGEWGKLKPQSISLEDYSSLPDPAERAAFELLEADSGYSSGYYSRFTARSEFALREGVAASAMEALAATGRLVWTLDASGSPVDPQVVRWDSGADYRLTVAIEPHTGDDGKNRIRARPFLQRAEDEQAVAISDVLAATDDGILLLADRACTVDAKQASAIRRWQSVGTIEVPQRSLLTLLDEAVKWTGLKLQLDPELDVTDSTPVPRPSVRLSSQAGSANWLEARLEMIYGDVSFDYQSNEGSNWDRSTKSLVQRDHQAEDAWLESLDPSHFRFSGLGTLEIARRHLPELVRHLTQAGWQVTADGNVVRRAGSFNVSVESGQDWFDLNASADFDGQSASLPELLAALKKGQDFVVLDDGSHGMLPEEWLSKFVGYDKTGEVDEDSIRFGKNQALLLDALLSDQEDVCFDRAFQAWCDKLNSFSGIGPAAAPEGFQGELREYQQLGLGWFHFLQDFCLGGCLADDMGLGKTIQVLAMLEERRASGNAASPSLIVVPRSLIVNWLEEAKKFAPQLRVLDYTGTDRASLADQFKDADAIVTTYGTLRNDIVDLREHPFDYMILDEAQAIKNPQSQASKACRLVRSEHRLAMTGTPVENHLGDLWSIFEFLNPGMLGHTVGSVFANVDSDDSERLAHVASSLRPFILRRTKEQVLTELPEKTEQTLYCDMEPKQRKLYKELRDHYRDRLASKIKQDGLAKSKIQVLEALLRLRQTACDPRLVNPESPIKGAKIARLMEQLEEVVSEGHKALVFSQFTSLLSLVRQEIDQRGWTYEYLDGKTQKRGDRVKHFQEDADCPLFLISLKAGGHGLNLTAADYVFILDPWWNPAVEAQAIDRAHRMGQTKPVVAYRMICRETVEEKIVDLQTSKKKLADAIISQQKSLVSDLTSDDLRMLFE